VATITGTDLLARISSYWNLVFSDRGTLQAHLDDLASDYLQTLQNLTEAINAVSVDLVPIFHREFWVPLHLTEASGLTIDEYFIRYAEETSRIYGNGLTYGQRASLASMAVPVPTGLVGLEKIFNRIIDPSLSLVNDTDYTVTPSAILFNSDPFTNVLIPKRDILDSKGVVVDREILLWGYNGDFDWSHIWTHFGYVLGIRGTSSDIYKAVIQVFWKSRVSGFTLKFLHQLLAAVTGIPLSIEAQETVLSLGVDQVVTDSHTYAFSNKATITVQPGQILPAGSPVTDGLEITELQPNKTFPAPVTYLILSPDWFSYSLEDLLAFPNASSAVIWLGQDSSGIAEARFAVFGKAEDLTAFWESVHAAGKAAGNKTVAQLLDTRVNKIGEPAQSDLPATINPAQFVSDNLIGPNLFLIQLKLDQVMVDTSNLSFLSSIRGVIQPHTAYLILIQASVSAESYNIGSGDSNEILDSTSLTSSVGSAPLSEAYDAAVSVTELVNLKYTTGP